MLKKAFILVAALLVLDQLLKIWVKTHFELGESLHMLGLRWAQLYFIENEGMAFGWKIAGENGKLFLSLFRLVAIIGIGIYMVSLVRRRYHPGLVMSIAIIMAGAAGNMIDSAFYGLIFSESTGYGTATMFPEGGGYGTFLHGKVVDMFYFPVIDTTWPSWVKWKAGEQLIFFRPIFNLADSYISIGVGLLIVFQRRFFAVQHEEPLPEAQDVPMEGEPESTTTSTPHVNQES